MKILVTLKRIPNPDEPLKFTVGGLDYSSHKWVPNAFDEYAVEAALRLAEKVGAPDRLAEVIVLSICPQGQRQHLIQFLGMGADRAIVVDADEDALDTGTVAKAIAAVYKREGCDLLIAGKLSQDNEGNQIAQRVAGILGAPQACFAATVEWDRGQRALIVSREVDDGVEVKRIPLPAVVSVDLRIVLPTSVQNGATPANHAYKEGARLASLRGITLAKKKPFQVLSLGDLGLGGPANERAVAVKAPPARKAGQIVGSVDDLFDKLTKEAKVL
ncbi:MAG: electron transfer flavoprotein subunit beta/FixA family protein [Nannocystis sp.]|nr:electron transfer flavoprotein subunit beta/FixA family protein [Nannocystis sp.]